MWSQGPGNETWRIWHLRWTLRCGEGPDRWKRFEKVVQGEGPTGAKAQRLEKYEFFFTLPAKEHVCRTAEEGGVGRRRTFVPAAGPGWTESVSGPHQRVAPSSVSFPAWEAALVI